LKNRNHPQPPCENGWFLVAIDTQLSQSQGFFEFCQELGISPIQTVLSKNEGNGSNRDNNGAEPGINAKQRELEIEPWRNQLDPLKPKVCENKDCSERVTALPPKQI